MISVAGFFAELQFKSKKRQFKAWIESAYGISWNQVAVRWWQLKTTDRVIIAKRLWESYGQVRVTKVRAESTSAWIGAQCLSIAIVRNCVLSDMSLHYKLIAAQYESNGYVRNHIDDEYNDGLCLPAYVVTIANKTFGHAINAFLIGEDYSVVKNYIFFDRARFDINPFDGSYGMFPTGCKVEILNTSHSVARYAIDSVGAVRPEVSHVLFRFDN